jgi:hypothetical protein
MFEMVPTPESTKVAEIGYDEANKELFVKFLKGESYIYMNVPREEWDGLRTAGSKGMYVNLIIKAKYGARPAVHPGQVATPAVNVRGGQTPR